MFLQELKFSSFKIENSPHRSQVSDSFYVDVAYFLFAVTRIASPLSFDGKQADGAYHSDSIRCALKFNCDTVVKSIVRFICLDFLIATDIELSYPT